MQVLHVSHTIMFSGGATLPLVKLNLTNVKVKAVHHTVSGKCLDAFGDAENVYLLYTLYKYGIKLESFFYTAFYIRNKQQY